MMQNISQEPQAPSENESGYAPVSQPEYQKGMSPQNGYQQRPYVPEQPSTSYYQGHQQQFWNQQTSGRWAPGDVSPFERTSMGMKARTAGMLSYLFGWVTGLIFLLFERENRFVRFHAMQSLLFFGFISVLDAVVRSLEAFYTYGYFGTSVHILGWGAFSSTIGLISFICWIVLLVSAHRGKSIKLPLFGNLAERYANKVGSL